jgi:hypothetical protein
MACIGNLQIHFEATTKIKKKYSCEELKMTKSLEEKSSGREGEHIRVTIVSSDSTYSRIYNQNGTDYLGLHSIHNYRQK